MYLTNFYEKYFQNLRHNIKNAGSYFIRLHICPLETRGWFFQNPLSVMKVIFSLSLALKLEESKFLYHQS